MQVFHHWTGLDGSARGASVAMGNFDGLHLGHRAVIDMARRSDAPLGVITFEPHPREFFFPDAAPFRLMNAQARAHRLDMLGVERLYELPFDSTLSQLSARDFAVQVLHDGLGIRHVVIGADFLLWQGAHRDSRRFAGPRQ